MAETETTTKVLNTPQEVFDAFVAQKDPTVRNSNTSYAPISEMKVGNGWPEFKSNGFNYKMFDQTTFPQVTVTQEAEAAETPGTGA